MDSPEEKDIELKEREQYVSKHELDEKWKRSMLLAHGKTQADIYAESAEREPLYNRVIVFLKIQIFLWVYHYLKSRFGGKWPFQNYSAYPDDDGIYELPASPLLADDGPTKIMLAGDWGSGTEDAFYVAESAKLDWPHFTIHLGDIYFVGAPREVEENMLGGKVRWPPGSFGSFALNANHEMYARGKAYFDLLLPTLGMNGTNGQKASFFCLKNDHWLVVGLDTGYYSVGLPILEMLFRPDARLHDDLVAWLKEDLRIQEDDQRGIILLSHHQYYSQFEQGYDRPAQQLAELIDRPVLWFWGHEHRFALYGLNATEQGKLEAYGRCVGHGGLPIEDISALPRTGQRYDNHLVLYDRRVRTLLGSLHIPVGFNGYANLLFDGLRLTVEYKDTEQLLVREVWEAGAGGMLQGISIEQFVDDPDLALHQGAALEDAIR